MEKNESVSRKNLFKIVVIGDSNVGKTSLLTRYTKGTKNETKPTVGADFSKKEVFVNDTIVTVTIWDTAGQEMYQSLSYTYYRGSDCCVLVYDITNKQSFERLEQWKNLFIEQMGCDADKFPFVVMGNKCDLEDDRVISADQARAWCQKNGNIPYFETSATVNTNIDEAFMSIIQKAIDL